MSGKGKGAEGLDAFVDAVSGGDEDIDLARAALLVARSEYPRLDLERYLRVIDAMACEVGERMAEAYDVDESLRTLNAYLFRDKGFAGNVQDYSDPRNSFLNEVIDRRLGVPISLSLLYIEVGQRAGLPLHGVSFPGHFLVKLSADSGDIVLDPFLGGAALSREDLDGRLHHLVEGRLGRVPDLEEWLVPATKREILLRMLRNLKAIYLKAGDHPRALNAIEHMLRVRPAEPVEIRDRGLVLHKLECFRAASSDYQRYLELVPEAEDVEDIRVRFIDSYRSAQRLH